MAHVPLYDIRSLNDDAYATLVSAIETDPNFLPAFSFSEVDEAYSINVTLVNELLDTAIAIDMPVGGLSVHDLRALFRPVARTSEQVIPTRVGVTA